MRAFFLTSLLLACSLIGEAQKKLGLTYRADSSMRSFSVIMVMEDNAAEKAGVKPGDQIFAINGKKLWGRTLDEIASLFINTPAPYQLNIRRVKETSLSIKVDTISISISPETFLSNKCISGDCTNGTGRLKDLQTEEVFAGSFINGVFTKGTVYYKSGRIKFSGTFKDGKLDGPGGRSYYDRDGEASKGSGTFTMGVVTNGEFRSADGKTFSRGTFNAKGLPHGKDFYYTNDKFTYRGDMVDGQATGYAKSMTWQQGNYEGPVIKGQPEGKGQWNYQGRSYKGRWEKGMKQGNFNVIEKTGAGRYHHVYRYVNDVQR